MNLYGWFEKIRLKNGLKEFNDLDGWRNYYFGLMLILGLILVPIALVVTLPSYISDKHYEIIAFELAIVAFLFIATLMRNSLPRGIVSFLFFSSMILTFFISLGPFYARPGWIVLSAVTAALLFGARAALAVTAFNAALLIVLYLFVGPHLRSWAPVYAEPVGTWIIFVTNISLISLVASLPVSLLLTRLHLSFLKGIELQEKSRQESEALKEMNTALHAEIADRERAEDALRQSEATLRSFFRVAPVGLCIMKDRRMLSINRVWFETFGYAESDFMGQSSRMLYENEEEYARVGTKLYGALSEGGLASVQTRHLHKDGTIRDVNLTAASLQPGDPSSGLVVTIEDITDRKRAEEALRQSEATLRSVFAAAPVGLCIMKDRIFLSANKVWFDIIGYSDSDEIIGQRARMLYENEEEYERVGGELQRGLSEQGLVSVQTRHRRKDGTVRDVNLTAAPFQPGDPLAGTVVAVEDITERKRIEEDLRANRRQLEGIIEFLPDATIVIDGQGRVIAWNRAMEAMTGIRKEAMIGKGDYEYALAFYGTRRPLLIDLALHPDRATERYYTAVQKIGDAFLGEAFASNLRPGGVHVSAAASVLRDDKGVAIAAIECIRDITERKRLEDRLNRAEKMEGLGRLAGGVAHDLNNVLGVLVGYSELMRDEIPEADPLRKYADNILQSGLRGAAIIQDLLTLARRGVAISEVVNLNQIITDYFKTPEFENIQNYHATVTFRNELGRDLLSIKGSAVHLGKTIMNLVANAAEAIPAEGEVVVKTENRHLDKPVRGYDDMQEGDYVVLTVSDNGQGISSQDIGNIFEPFYTKKVMGRSGTGLGLAVVWGTVKDHNGYIDVQSEEGRGSVFTLYFPVTREEAVRAEGRLSLDSYAGRGESILVVDDVKEQRELAVRMMKRLGYKATAASSGEDAVEYVRNHDVDLIVLDMIMDPGIDGLTTYEKILAIRPGQKAIIVSGFSETERVKTAQDLGAGAYVRKPYVLEKLGLALRAELDRT